MRFVILAALLARSALAVCTPAVTAPTANQVVSGLSFTFTATLSGCTGVDRVQYLIGDHPAETPWQTYFPMPVASAAQIYGYANAATNYALVWNTFGVWNGTEAVKVQALDKLGTVLATSAPVTFSVANSWPVSYVPTLTVSPSCTSACSGNVTLSTTMGGSGATNNKTIYTFIGGLHMGGTFTGSTTPSFTLDTTQFADGTHILGFSSTDTVGGTPYNGVGSGGSNYVGTMAQWTQAITTSNGTAPMYINTGIKSLPCRVGGTFQLTPALIATNGSTIAGQTFTYYSQNTPVASVSSTGLITCNANGYAIIRVADLTGAGSSSGADLGCVNGTCTSSGVGANVFSTAHPFTHSVNQVCQAGLTYFAICTGSLLQVLSTNGWSPGLYEFSNSGTQVALFSVANNNSSSAAPGFGSTGLGSFNTGLGSYVIVYVQPSNAVPVFTANNTIDTGGTGANAVFVLAAYQSANALPNTFAPSTTLRLGKDAPYTPGFLLDFQRSGLNTIETGLLPPINPNTYAYSLNIPSGQAPCVSTGYTQNWSTEAAFEAAINSNTSAIGTAAAPYGIKFGLSGDSFSGGCNIYANLRGPTVAGASPYTTPPLTYMFQKWGANAGVRYAVMHDETDTQSGLRPLPPNMSWGNPGFLSIVNTAGSCTATYQGGLVPTASAFGYLGITGSSPNNGFNSLTGFAYHITGGSLTTIVFACPSASVGTYNSTNDPTLTVQWLAFSQYNQATGSSTVSPNDFTPNNAFGTMYTWASNAGTGRPLITWSPKAIQAGGCASESHWQNPNDSDGPVGELGDIYWPSTDPAGSTNYYLASQEMFNQYRYQEAFHVQPYFGCLSSTEPISVGNVPLGPNTYGFNNNFTQSVATFTGTTLTLTTPHGLNNLVRGMSRVVLSAMSNSADNGNYYIESIVSPTAVTLSRDATDFTCTGTGGTLTFIPSGYSPAALTSITASGTHQTQNGVFGNAVVVSGATDTNLPHHLGETFQVTGVTGTGCGTFATRTFLDVAENKPAPGNNNFTYREMAIGSSASGTAMIIPDNTSVHGRNGDTGGLFDPLGVHLAMMEGLMSRASMLRLYQLQPGYQDYDPANGWAGMLSVVSYIFSDQTNGSVQNQGHPYWQNGLVVPAFWSASMTSLLLKWTTPFFLATMLPAPDAGPWIDCYATTSAKGKALTCANILNEDQPITMTLTPYEASGQNVVRALANGTGIVLNTIAAGTASDTLTLPRGSTVTWLFPLTFAGMLNQPMFSIPAASIPSGGSWAIRWTYGSPFWMDGSTLPTTIDCGSATSCTPPVDLNIGQLYYRIGKTDASGVTRWGDVMKY